MEIALCAIAKHENDYINYWLRYHLNLGFDKIYLYDNNESTYEKVTTRIDNDLLDKVEIFNVNDLPGKQADRYQECYDKYGHLYDWIIFLDLDEYITPSTDDHDLKKFLSKPEFSNIDEVEMCWKNYGDGGMIERDISIPVPEAGFTPSPTYKFAWVKSFLRTNKPLTYFTHIGLGVNGYQPKCALTNGQETTTNMVKDIFCGEFWYVRHYRTKTLSEYLKNKFNRTDCFSARSKTNLNYFFETNPRTKEHDNYLRKLGLIK